MNGKGVFVGAVLTVVTLAAAAIVMQHPGAAQGARTDVVDIPGIGRVDLNQLPPDVRDNIRIPGVVYDEPPEQYGDLPPLPEPNVDDLDLQKPPAPGGESQAPEGAPAKGDGGIAPLRSTRQEREEALRRMYEERAFPLGMIPEDAYDKAWEHIQRMPPAPPFEDVGPSVVEPQSLWDVAKRWVLARLSPARVVAQGASPPWTMIGPAPLIPGPNNMWAGFVGQIAPHPTTLNTVYIGSYGGIWKTTDGGVGWSSMTHTQETQRAQTVILHPSNPDVVFAGTGWGFFFDVPLRIKLDQTTEAELGRGILRSINGGSGWCRVGPAWPIGTTNVESKVAIFNLTADSSHNPVRIYAATDRGLFYSDNAYQTGNPPATTLCAAVQWTQVGGGLPTSRVKNILIGKWNNPRTLYASTDTGFYCSANDGTTWTAMSSGLPLSINGIRSHATIAKNPPTSGQDILYVPVDSSEHVQCGFTTDRVYRGISTTTPTSCTATWTVLGTPTTPAFNCEHGIRSVEIHPTNSNVVAVGADAVHLSTDGGNTFTNLMPSSAPEGVHPDQNDLVFGPPSAPGGPNSLYTSNDGGIWKRNDYALAPFSNLNGNLANILFYQGTVDTLNYGMSWGGTQDNGDMKGGNELSGNQLKWYAVQGGDGSTNIVDYTDSNVAYFINAKTTDGGLTRPELLTCQLTPSTGATFPTLVMDPTNSKALAIYGGATQKVYRTTNGGELPCETGGWTAITNTPSAIAGIRTLAIAPSQSPPNPSNLIFAGVGDGTIWRTSDASTWSSFSPPSNGLPVSTITSLAIDPTGACTIPNCTLYASVSGFLTDHVFRSTNAGANWSSISGSGGTVLPDIPVNKVVVHPTNPTVVWAATDLTVLQGCTSVNGTSCNPAGTSWIWGTYNTSLPAGVFVNDLAVHKDSGLLRAFTFGRSAWEVQAFTPPNPDQKVNTTNPVTNVFINSVRVSSGNGGQQYAVSWFDDRLGANNWHVYFRGYNYDANNKPTPLAVELRVDDTSTHLAQAPAVSGHPTLTAAPYCAWFAWHDDRLNPWVNQHVFSQYMCTDGSKLFINDLRADQHNTDINATKPAVTFQQNLSFAVAWQADRSAGSTLRDIYARFFGVTGGVKGPQLKVNVSALNATAPAAVSDFNSNVFIAWEEFDAATQNGRIMMSKYTRDGVFLAGPVPVDNNGAAATGRHGVALAIDAGGNVIATWWERKSDGTQPEGIFRRRLNNTLGFLDNETQVNKPPGLPAGAQRGRRGDVATDSSSNFLITWEASVNDPSALTWNAFARGFSSTATTLKNDFRADLAPRSAAVQAPRAARSPFTNCYAEAWRDNRSGHYDVYTRLVVAVPQ